MIDFEITSNIEAIPEWLDETKERVILQSARSAINKTLKSASVLAIKRIKLTYKVKPSGFSRKEIKKRMDIIKATGNSLFSINGEIIFKGEPIPILNFVSGKKTSIKQKGIKVRKRRKLRVEIRPGKRVVLKKAFIQDGPKSKQVFRSPKSGGFKKQSVPGMGLVINRPENKQALLRHVSRAFAKTFDNQVKFRLEKANQRLRRKRLKKFL